MRKLENSGIKIFKETFNYLMDEVLTESQFCDLMRLIYLSRWGQEDDLYELEDRVDFNVNLIWRNLRHSVAKAKSNEEVYRNRKQRKEIAQIQEIEEKEYKDTTSASNAEIQPIYDAKNKEYLEDINIDCIIESELEDEEKMNIDIDSIIESEVENEDEMNVIKYNDFVIANDPEDDFRQLLRDNVDLLGCMSYDGLTKYPIAYKFLTSNDISRQTVDRVLSEERKRRMENKWAI